jgi:capsid protein
MPDIPEPSLAQLREQVERQELLLRQRTLETAANWYDDYVNPAEPLFDTPDFFFPLAGENLPFNLDNRLKGELLPVYVTEYGLKILRDYSRWLAAFNVFALNALENRVSYVVGKGFGYQAVPTNGPASDYTAGDRDLCKKAQRVIDRFLERTDWGELEQEVMRRADRDGEAFLRFFHTGGGRCTVRTVEPEHVRSPGDQSAHLSFGVETPEHDVQDAHAFWIVEEPSVSWSPSRVPAGEVVHIRFNVDRTAKRGYPTLVPVRKNLLRADKLLQNMSTLAQVQATFALIRKHKQYSASAVSAWQQGQADLAVSDPLGGSTRYLQRYLPGTILDVPEQTDYEFPAARVPADSLVAVLQAELRAVAARLVLPEYMLTSNAENANYASTLVAEAPAVKHFERLQRQLSRAFGDGRYGGPRRCGALWRVLECAVRWGDLPREVLRRVALHVEPPSPVARDKDKETTRAQTLNRAGVLSKATWAKWEGLDPAREWRLIRQERKEDKPKEDNSRQGLQGNASFAESERQFVEEIHSDLDKNQHRYCWDENGRVPCTLDSAGSGKDAKAADRPASGDRSKPDAEEPSGSSTGSPPAGSGGGKGGKPPGPKGVSGGNEDEPRSAIKQEFVKIINERTETEDPETAASLLKRIVGEATTQRGVPESERGELVGAVLLGHEFLSRSESAFDTRGWPGQWRDAVVVQIDVKVSQRNLYDESLLTKGHKALEWKKEQGIPAYVVIAKGHGVYLHVGIDPITKSRISLNSTARSKRPVVEPDRLGDAIKNMSGTLAPFVKLADWKDFDEIAEATPQQVTTLRGRVKTALRSLDMGDVKRLVDRQIDEIGDAGMDDFWKLAPHKFIDKAVNEAPDATLRACLEKKGWSKERIDTFLQSL